MTKSDRRRVLAALTRWEARWSFMYEDPEGTPSRVLGGSVDWLRCLSKLAAEHLDPGDTGWTDEHLVQAAMLVRAECLDFANEIRAEAKNL